MYVYLYVSRSVIQAVPDVLPAAGLPVALHPARQSHLLVAEAQQEGAQTGQCPERDPRRGSAPSVDFSGKWCFSAELTLQGGNSGLPRCLIINRVLLKHPSLLKVIRSIVVFSYVLFP